MTCLGELVRIHPVCQSVRWRLSTAFEAQVDWYLMMLRLALVDASTRYLGLAAVLQRLYIACHQCGGCILSAIIKSCVISSLSP